MLDWFEWNGESCKDYGIVAVELPPITAAQERVKWETVAGRSGSLALLEGEDVYEDITFNCACILTDPSRLDAALGWLRGAGTLTFANRPGGWYEARVGNQIELGRVIPVRDERRFALTFRAKPYFYLADVEDIEITSQTALITNPGNLPSAPRITVYGSGTVGLLIGGQMVTLADLTDGIILDGELLDALDLTGAQLLNDKMTGDFPTLPPGASNYAWFEDEDAPGGSVTRIVIEPRWRCR